MAYSRWQIADRNRLRSLWGFTLIELLISVSIIAILISIAVVQYRSVNQKSRDGKRKADLEQVRSALELYRADNPSGYPAADAENMIPAALAPNYINPIPRDPLNTAKNYTYYYNRPTATTYTLCAYLEADTTGTCTGSPDCETGAETTLCNFSLIQP